jgi:hypothetical protein
MKKEHRRADENATTTMAAVPNWKRKENNAISKSFRYICYSCAQQRAKKRLTVRVDRPIR